MKGYLLLLLAIVAEVGATTALTVSNGFTKALPATLSVLGYGAAAYLLSLTLRSIPVGIAYACWSGIGTMLIVIIRVIAFNQKLDFPATAGIALIVVGVLIINLLSSAAHR